MKLIVEYEKNTYEELLVEERTLLDAALKATENAYAPFSHFQVGCAVALSSGEVILGNNQENKAFPSGICAERTALFYVGSLGKSPEIRMIAIRAKSEKIAVNQPVTPCGACRQVMLESETLAGTDITVLMMGEVGEVLKVKGVKKTLLPFCFEIEF
ncbi:MAG: cytidine deaminase [Bacteroidia bacterium]